MLVPDHWEFGQLPASLSILGYCHSSSVEERCLNVRGHNFGFFLLPQVAPRGEGVLLTFCILSFRLDRP